MRLTSLAICIILLSLILIPTNIVYACSGPAISFEGGVERTSLIVRATVISTDSQSENSIIKVDTYFKGEGSEYLLIAGNTLGLTNGLKETRYGGGDCAGRYPTMPIGETVYLFLEESFPGTYRLAFRIFGDAFFYFSDEHTTERILLQETED